MKNLIILLLGLCSLSISGQELPSPDIHQFQIGTELAATNTIYTAEYTILLKNRYYLKSYNAYRWDYSNTLGDYLVTDNAIMRSSENKFWNYGVSYNILYDGVRKQTFNNIYLKIKVKLF